MTKTKPDIFLVFQMAKVASRSWMKLLEATLPNSTIVHFHVISDKRVNRVKRLIEKTDRHQTIKHLTNASIGHPPKQIQPFIVNGQWIGPETKIITGVRDPVARAISAVGFQCNRLGYTRFGVTPRDGGTAENLIDIFYRALKAAQSNNTQNDTLVSHLARVITNYNLWFKEELTPAFGVDISNTPFNRETRCLQLNGKHSLFAYRVEDLLNNDTEKILLKSTSDFIGERVTNFPQSDTSKENRYQALYTDFVKKIKLSDKDMDWFYNNDVVSKFYSPHEVEVFKSRWRRH